MKIKSIAILTAGILILDAWAFICSCDAFLFHATKKAAAKRIMRTGFNKARMKASARFGKGIYTSTNRRTALKEGKGKAVIRFKESAYLKKNTINMKNPDKPAIQKQLKNQNLKGSIKNKIIGPKLGKKLGKAAGKKGKVIQYRSVKGQKGSNIFIPKRVYENHPKVIHSKKIIK